MNDNYNYNNQHSNIAVNNSVDVSRQRNTSSSGNNGNTFKINHVGLRGDL